MTAGLFVYPSRRKAEKQEKTLRAITSAITADREFHQTLLTLLAQLGAKKPLPLSVNGLSDGARDAFLTEVLRTVAEKKPGPSLLLAGEEGEALALAAMLTAEGLPAVYYPPRDFVFLNISASRDTDRTRLSVLCRVLRGEELTVVCTPYAALQATMPPAVLDGLAVRLEMGDTFPPEELARRLARMGFAHVDAVDGVGQFARRGGILDFYPAGVKAPVRVEFFDDEIDRMGYFDPLTQRLSEPCPYVEIFPAKEFLPAPEMLAALRAAEEALCRKAEPETFHALTTEIAALDAGTEPLFADRYAALLYPEGATLLSYFRPGTLCPVLADSGMQEKTETLLSLLAKDGTDMVERGLLSPKYNRFSGTWGDLARFLSAAVPLYISGFGNSYNGALAGLFGFRARRTVSYYGKPLLLKDDLKNLLAGFYRVLIVTESENEAATLADTLREDGYRPVLVDGNAPFDYSLLDKGAVGICHGAVSAGFELLVPKIAVLSTLPDEGARRRRVRRERKATHIKAGQKIMSYADLSVGDYVVHTVHGIGIFEGMQQLTVDGVTKDYITLRYAGTDTLFLPADRLEMIAKYIGAKSEDGKVKLSKLGGSDWQKSKARAKAAAKDMAKQLVSLYARRQRLAGYAFPADSDMERDFADSFEFEETDPQLQAIAEISADMERPVPMDRLLCGDVGFGKTEVALRAAFKAVCAGKQVAILVPTTILAMQHYQTVISRMRGYPVNIEMISRLRTQKEQESILRRLARGEIDLIVGTHALLGKRVEFRNLGLLIVDEEQRFGVGQKEKLKEMADGVDVLTLTATPIPRTLNMAMSGIRDMSILDEAPADRYPVQTYVMEHDDLVIHEAVRKELARGGQVLYLYNRVESMERPAAKLARAFPEARIAIAHGKMEKEELEDIWQSLVRGELDILVCTTIIETGVDLPNANTLIIEDADRMGLSQLHQIRGRVGRSGRHAYAYFTYRRGKEISEVADKRLKAIKEYAEFGAGFKIALRDLEIRGAGNLLGAEQHGHIDSVGYDLYVKILNEAILEEKGVAKEEVFESQADLAVSANIPEDYIATSAERMEMYKKISLIRNERDMSDVLDEFCDRYGEPPREVSRLLEIATARSIASHYRIARLESKDGYLRISMEKPDLAVWSVLFCRHKNLRFSPSAGANATPTVLYRMDKGEDAADAAFTVMTEYRKAKMADDSIMPDKKD